MSQGLVTSLMRVHYPKYHYSLEKSLDIFGWLVGCVLCPFDREAI